MPVGDLQKLWKLHLVDSQLHSIRARAAALDPGRKLAQEIAALQAKHDELHAVSNALHEESTDLELAQKSDEAKIKKFNDELFSGKVVNSREVENIQKEIDMLKRRNLDRDTRLLEIMEVAPPAMAETKRAMDALNAKKSELQVHQQQVLKEKSRLEAAYKEAMANRPALLAAAPKIAIPRYEALLKKLGTAMAQITKAHTCEACGMHVAEKSLEMVREERIVTCEGCHRILYYTEGLI